MTRKIVLRSYADIPDEVFTRWPAGVFHRVAALCPSVDAGCPRPVWLDHQSVETDADGNNRYVCHPLDLDTDAWADFCALEMAGYRIRVTGGSNYLPGRTVRVELRLPGGAS
ncbi:hypothetical protein ACTXM9_05545 [Corynebacterium variabile]|uniref:hypothetical protein n=1 Tax=Corynebacterium variabile TaxID=1727 RepID=UPI003F8DF850